MEASFELGEDIVFLGVTNPAGPCGMTKKFFLKKGNFETGRYERVFAQRPSNFGRAGVTLCTYGIRISLSVCTCVRPYMWNDCMMAIT